MDSKIATLDNQLCLISAHLGIDKKVTNHVARPTFASIADDSKDAESFTTQTNDRLHPLNQKGKSDHNMEA